ncbi:ceramidase domain-containing protein [Magnetovibrio sp.]|uniref:ceramidase domain-containing protein n=1 Tax=Magnetovibrio sp. TaxID=2024836 RepID=UPI002F953BAE
MSDTIKPWVVGGVALGLAAAMLIFVAPISQPLAYHDFADLRDWLGIPNFGDVMSNVPFIAVGLYGLWVLSRQRGHGNWTADARLPLAAFFIGVALVGPGSAYYHWAPDNATLFWDRLPMTVGFMGLLAAVITDRVDARIGVRLALPVLIAVGVFSAVYWRITDDLRVYILVQFLPVVIIPMIMWLWSHGKWITWRAIIGAFVFYALAKLTEHFDGEVLAFLGKQLSGHTLKHLFAAMGPLAVAVTLNDQS